ncbi:potassium transporter TrkG [Methanohalobium evestigatum]|uniref:potassium transporter TrkG n=1 Tax=Methanohalobium evestigatum TaxID=2322 RepID=UPI000A00F242|nr:potassium transporter TrkG [Methanohalobium evestigatum]
MREAFAIVAFGWISVVLFGTIPYLFYDIGFVDALFESMSGFTATGSTVLVGIESYPKGLLFWRSMTQWLGGMGIIVLFISILPKIGVGGRQMFRAEMPGIQEDKLDPLIRGTAKILWMVYLVLTVLQTVSMKMAGASLYDAITHERRRKESHCFNSGRNCDHRYLYLSSGLICLIDRYIHRISARV